MRSNLELLQLCKLHFEKYFVLGLCQLVSTLSCEDIIAHSEKSKVLKLIIDNRPDIQAPPYRYYWQISIKEPRLKWLDKMIIKYTINDTNSQDTDKKV